MQLVGYGSNSEEDYWIVRNSYGENWGEEGYIRLKRNATPKCEIYEGRKYCGQCGILYQAAYPIGVQYTQTP